MVLVADLRHKKPLGILSESTDNKKQSTRRTRAEPEIIETLYEAAQLADIDLNPYVCTTKY